MIENLTIHDVVELQNKLMENNVGPPYELRATREALAGLLQSLDGARMVASLFTEERPRLRPGEKYVGRMMDTFLIQVE